MEPTEPTEELKRKAENAHGLAHEEARAGQVQPKPNA